MAKDDAKKLEDLQERERQIKAQIRDLKAREREKERKRETRRKILIGGSIMAEINRGSMGEDELRQILDRNLTADRDRELFGLSASTPNKG